MAVRNMLHISGWSPGSLSHVAFAGCGTVRGASLAPSQSGERPEAGTPVFGGLSKAHVRGTVPRGPMEGVTPGDPGQEKVLVRDFPRSSAQAFPGGSPQVLPLRFSLHPSSPYTPSFPKHVGKKPLFISIPDPEERG